MLKRLNLHIDETGSQDISENIYLIAVVLHEHTIDIESQITKYERRLADSNLANIPFHGKDLLHGNEKYKMVSVGDRKRLLTQFARFVRELPISYFLLKYETSDIHNSDELESRIRHDLVSFIYDHLVFFQRFDVISVYYDNGQNTISIALHDALDFILAKNVADFRDADHSARRLLQVADYICTIERVNIFYNIGKQTKTHERFFGNRRNFSQSFTKQLVRKKIST